MKIRSAEFIVSNTDVSKCPSEPLPEYAFIGRSNVGKSSLINMLTERKHLAKISGRPGKTQLINHFRINENWFLVDLPGYGYARTSKKDKAAFQKLIHRYFRERRQLISAFLLVDIRHEPQPIDLEFMEWLTGQQVPFAIIFTKSDKLKPGAVERRTGEYLQAMRAAGWEDVPPYFVTSSLKGEGKDEVLGYIDGINRSFREAAWGTPQ
ncbi:ribosome biogenesis GTP-binding protein YihA/YsxC [Robiginitalea sp. SC105]|uniref:ribosome biogenesis GTP-binding protein YihA/YsxC n=1 Tax=Robiginitalea sp. SC105 TaxID=2762332 RepID=UPI00163A6CF3|nr:ribosome biogenesis GTP-binding protein YihA/YsxC [Robiginitalea sp. SC105]MBC2838975.1 YihA family ribosome biogenesis GTP-binding protein [Robiginitalea sp. SC105]